MAKHNLHKSQWDVPEPMFSVIKAARGITKLRDLLGLKSIQSILNWTRVPEHHLDKIWVELRLHPISLRPDLFDPAGQKIIKPFQNKNPIRRRRYQCRPNKIKPEHADMRWLK